MDFKIVWTDPAIADLEAIVRFIARENPTVAVRVGFEILNHVEVLATFPFSGPVYPRGSTGRIREIVCRQYRIFYRVIEDRRAVEILAAWHGQRGDPGALL